MITRCLQERLSRGLSRYSICISHRLTVIQSSEWVWAGFIKFRGGFASFGSKDRSLVLLDSSYGEGKRFAGDGVFEDVFAVTRLRLKSHCRVTPQGKQPVCHEVAARC